LSVIPFAFSRDTEIHRFVSPYEALAAFQFKLQVGLRTVPSDGYNRTIEVR